MSATAFFTVVHADEGTSYYACSVCGGDVGPGDRYCRRCGAHLEKPHEEREER